MTLKQYLSALTIEERIQFADRAGTRVQYLYHLKGGHRKAGPALARRMVVASGGALSLGDVRPDLWGDSA